MYLKRLLILVAAFAGLTTAATAAERPNFVLFLSDDHGYLDSPVYGSRVVKTPNLERLAREGTAFTHCFVGSPSCGPSRAVIHTGLYSARNGAEGNHSGIRVGVKTLPTYLKELGYRTVLFGKSHLAPRQQYQDLEIVPSNINNGPLNADLDVDKVERWLRDRDPADERPLCLLVCSHSPHVYWPENDGYDPAQVELPPTFVDTPETRAYRTQYYTDITMMDVRLGRVYDSVQRHLGKNTLFLYTTDHGAQWPFGKWNVYDAGIRVPLLAVWPGVLEPQTRSDAMISFADFLPTFIELAGGKPPGDLDGRSFAGLLTGKTETHRDEIFATHAGDGDMNVYPMRCIRTRRFKYIRNLYPEFEYTTHIDKGINKDGLEFWHSWDRAAESDPAAAEIVRRYHERPGEELYDVEADPFERNNLAAEPEFQQELKTLREKLDARMQQQEDAGRFFGKPRLLKTKQESRTGGRPNILFVYIDDMGYGDLSCYGNTDIETSNIDRLAAAGTRFTQFYVASPICSPSRVGVTTGQYPARHRIHSFIAARKRNHDRGMADWLDPHVPTLARTLQSAGYATAHFGKWHMGGGRDVGDAPLPREYGFSESLVSFEGLGDRVLPPGGLSQQSAQLGRGTIFFVAKDVQTRIYTDRAMQFIYDHRDDPFYVQVWLNEVHDPYAPNPRDMRRFARFKDNKYLQQYYATIHAMDHNIGRLVQAVDDFGLERETLIVLSSDNGPTAWPHYYKEGLEPPGKTGGLRGRKWSLYEGGIREPLIVRWPGRTPAGRVDETSVISAVDLFPTLCSLAGVETPDVDFDGVDVSRAFLGEAIDRDHPLFWEYGRDETYLRPGKESDQSPNMAVRDGAWKLLRNADGSRVELYNLDRDPAESKNLAEEESERAARMSAQLREWGRTLPGFEGDD